MRPGRNRGTICDQPGYYGLYGCLWVSEFRLCIRCLQQKNKYHRHKHYSLSGDAADVQRLAGRYHALLLGFHCNRGRFLHLWSRGWLGCDLHRSRSAVQYRSANTQRHDLDAVKNSCRCAPGIFRSPARSVYCVQFELARRLSWKRRWTKSRTERMPFGFGNPSDRP